jgi:hypothetical protein
LGDPGEIFRRPAIHRQGDNLRHVIAVQAPHGPGKRPELVPRGLDDQKVFLGNLDFPFPAVNRFHRRLQNVPTRSKPSADERTSNGPGFLERSARDEDHDFVCHRLALLLRLLRRYLLATRRLCDKIQCFAS